MEKNIYIMGNNISTEDMNYIQNGIAEDTPTNREYDYAASEILKNTKTWFKKLGGGICQYRITHWNNIEIPEEGENIFKEIVKSNYSESVAEKIIELIEMCSQFFMVSGVKNLTQFKEYWNNFFRPLIAA